MLLDLYLLVTKPLRREESGGDGIAVSVGAPVIPHQEIRSMRRIEEEELIMSIMQFVIAET